MKNSIKRAQSQARLSFAERENFRPKVRQLKKTLLTLVALLAVTTGAWADETPLLTIESTDYADFTSGSKTFDDKVTITFSSSVSNDGDNWGWYSNQESDKTITVTAASDAYTITRVKFYSAKGSAFDEEAPFLAIVKFEGAYITKVNGTSIGSWGLNKIEVYGYEGTAAPSAPSGPEVAWNKAEKTGSFKMPGGNVTLEPEYYPQAALTAAPTAIDDVPATTDGAIVSAGTVANIGETTTAQGTVMYYVSQTEMTDAALLALAADQWTADVPTAADLAQSPAYVYYYVRGNDSETDDEIFSDGDILAANALTVTLGAAPLWNAEFDLTDAPEEDKAGKWSTDIPEGGVVKGTEVTVTYSGTKKVIGVKAEKKGGAAGIVNPVVGQIIGSDGKNYAYGSLPTGVTAVAKICYVSGSNGLALALTDEEGEMNWSTAQTTCTAHTPAITGGTWKLPSKDEWDNMISAAGSFTDLRDGFSSVGGTNLQSGGYWSSTEKASDLAWYYYFYYGGWGSDNKDRGFYVRPCLAF